MKPSLLLLLQSFRDFLFEVAVGGDGADGAITADVASYPAITAALSSYARITVEVHQ